MLRAWVGCHGEPVRQRGDRECPISSRPITTAAAAAATGNGSWRRWQPPGHPCGRRFHNLDDGLSHRQHRSSELERSFADGCSARQAANPAMPPPNSSRLGLSDPKPDHPVLAHLWSADRQCRCLIHGRSQATWTSTSLIGGCVFCGASSSADAGRGFPGLKMVLGAHHQPPGCRGLCAGRRPQLAATITPITCDQSQRHVSTEGWRPHALLGLRWAKPGICTGWPCAGGLLQRQTRNFLLAPIQRHPRSAKESACGCAGDLQMPPMPWKAMPRVFLSRKAPGSSSKLRFGVRAPTTSTA